MARDVTARNCSGHRALQPNLLSLIMEKIDEARTMRTPSDRIDKRFAPIGIFV